MGHLLLYAPESPDGKPWGLMKQKSPPGTEWPGRLWVSEKLRHEFAGDLPTSIAPSYGRSYRRETLGSTRKSLPAALFNPLSFRVLRTF